MGWAVQAEAQVFTNGGFEAGTNTGWTTWPGSASVTTANVQSGTYAAQLVSSGSAVVVERELNLLPGLNATITGYMRGTSLPSPAKAQVDLVLVDSGSNTTTVNLGLQNATSSTYKQYTLNKWIPLGTQSTKLRLTLTNTGTANFDSFAVQYTTGKQLILNRGFESLPDFSGWTTTAGCTITTTGTHSGANAALVTPNTSIRQVMQDFPLAEGQKVTVRGYMSTNNMGTFSGSMVVRLFNSSGTPVGADLPIASANGTTAYPATPYALTFTATTGVVRGQVRLIGAGGTGCVGTVAFDDISVIEGDGVVKAFPGAEGFGSDTIGGRGDASNIVIYKVTNLGGGTSPFTVSANYGSGTLRAALQRNLADGKHYYILFSKAGIIDFHTGTNQATTQVNIKQPYVTIAGQTAPGDGICIKNSGPKITTHDVVIRGLRFRIGGIHYTGSGTNTGLDNLKEDDRDCLSFNQGSSVVSNCIVDHCSLAWSGDEQIQFYADANDGVYGTSPLTNLTISNCLFTEPMDDPWHLVYDNNDKHHAYQFSIDFAQDVSLHHNLFLHGQRRQPEIRRNSRVELINNLIYNHEQVATEFYGGAVSGTNPPMQALVIGNMYVEGPNSTYSAEMPNNPKPVNEGVRFNPGTPPNVGSKFYLLDNYGHYRTTAGQDEWTETDMPSTTQWPDQTNARVSTESAAMTGSGLTRTPIGSLEDVLLGQVAGKQFRPGAYPRDAVDSRAINDILTNDGGVLLATGTITPDGISAGPQGETPGPKAKNATWRTIVDRYRMEDQYGNQNGDQSDDWPTYSIGSLPDSNGNGIPNAWEDSNSNGVPDAWEANYAGGASFDPVAVSADGDGGYLNVEIYANSFIPPADK